MPKMVKKIFAAAMATALMLSFMTFGASAASAVEGIKVQLNGQELVFPDVTPFAENGRTYVPFRALFEALGASVDYDADTMTVTAVRGDKTVSFVLGQSEVTVKTGDAAETITIDAPAIARNSRTLVPVRFAAQALNCNVGWDQDDQTVIVDDVDAILAANTATYTVMDKYLAFSKQFNAAPHAVSGEMTLNMELLSENLESGGITVIINGSMNGLVDQTGGELSLTATSNLLEVLSESGNIQDVDTETLMLLSLLNNVQADFIINLETGMMYIRSETVNQMLGLEEGSWISFDFNGLSQEIQAGSGVQVSPTSLMNLSVSMDSFREYLSAVLKVIPLTDKDNTAVTMLALYNAMYSDQAFVKTGDSYVSAMTQNMDGIGMTVTNTFNLSGDTFNGYSVTMNMEQEGTVSMSMTAAMDAGGKGTLDMTLSVPDVMEMTVSGTIRYSATAETPAEAPSDGNIVPYES